MHRPHLPERKVVELRGGQRLFEQALSGIQIGEPFGSSEDLERVAPDLGARGARRQRLGSKRAGLVYAVGR